MYADLPAFDRSSLTADRLASRFYAQRPCDGWLTKKQARWLSDVWIRTGQHTDCPQPNAGLHGWGSLLDAAGAVIGRWELALNPLNGAGYVRYFLAPSPEAEEEAEEEELFPPLVEGSNNPEGNNESVSFKAQKNTATRSPTRSQRGKDPCSQ